jgi:ATP-dependent Clp protease ATP-binding subunit ClpA
MSIFFQLTGEINLASFDEALLQQTDNLNVLLAIASETKCAFIESTHILIALSLIEGGITQELFATKSVLPAQLQKGLSSRVGTSTGGLPPQRLTHTALDKSAAAVFQELDDLFKDSPLFKVTECRLLMATLKHLTQPVVHSIADIGLSTEELIAELKDCPDVAPSDPLSRESYSPAGQRVIHLMLAEAGALGYGQVDPRHLLMGLLELEGGATQTGIYQQNLIPKKLQEQVMVNLRSRATRQQITLALKQVFLSTQMMNILHEAAQLAAANHCAQIHEVHLLRAFLDIKSFALRLLTDYGVNLPVLRESARVFRPEDEPVISSMEQARSWEEIKDKLSSALVGQEHVVESCLPYIRRSLFGFKRPGKPAAVFLFCGPSGVGKTEMAKSLARAVYGSEDNLIMLEMGQFQTKESMSIFVGAPPGYVGYGEGKLTNGLRDKPRSVVLFDEVEKAHPEVFDALLRFIDEGRIDDPAGPLRDGSECVIVMTSNVGLKELQPLLQGSFQKNKWEIRNKLRDALLKVKVEHGSESSVREPFRFRPEFLNRIDEIILFRALEAREMAEIAQRYLRDYQHRLSSEKQIDVTYSPSLESAAWLIGRFCAYQKKEGSENEGARPILRMVLARVLDPVIDFAYSGNYTPPFSLAVHLMGDPKKIEEPVSIVGLAQPLADG